MPFQRYLIYLPIGLLALAFVGYSLWWNYAAGEVERQLLAYRDRAEDGGPRLSFSALQVGGYPFRIEAHMADASIAAPQGGFAAKQATLHFLPYRFDHVILSARGHQRLDVAAIGADGKPFPIAFEGSTAQTLASMLLTGGVPDRIDLDIRRFDGMAALGLDAPVRAQASSVEWHLRPSEDAPGEGFDVASQVVDMELLDGPEPLLGRTVKRAEFIATLYKLTPDLFAGAGLPLRDWTGNGGQVWLQNVEVEWGEVDVQVTGALKLDDQHRPEGDLKAFVAGHETLLEALTKSGNIAPRDATIARQVMALLALGGGDPYGRVPIVMKLEDGAATVAGRRVADLKPVY